MLPVAYKTIAAYSETMVLPPPLNIDYIRTGSRYALKRFAALRRAFI